MLSSKAADKKKGPVTTVENKQVLNPFLSAELLLLLNRKMIYNLRGSGLNTQ